MLNETESDEETWKLGWRMIENSWDENHSLAELQFDSLLSMNKPLGEKFLIIGLETKVELSKEEEANKILASQQEKIIANICSKEFTVGLKSCANLPEEKVENKELQLKIIKLFVDDQAVRDNIMQDIISKYQVDTSKISPYGMSSTDEINRDHLKEIFKEHGFPTRKLIGKDAMNGVFYIIQHADGDSEWQKSQLPNLELAVNKGDLVKKNYAYLYDRIQVNAGEKQRYGSQFKNVDFKKKIAELRETEDLANLDKRRREMGMMPIAMYKRLILKK